MTYIKNLRYITDNFAGEKAVDKIKEETAKELILDALDDEDLGVSIESLGLTLEDINDNKYMYNIEWQHKLEKYCKSSRLTWVS